MRRLVLDVRQGEYAITRLPARADLPKELPRPAGSALVSVTVTADEVSVVSPAELAPGAGRTRAGWRLLTVRGPLEFTMTGILASVAGALAAAGVSLFAVSTFDTDHVLVQDNDLDRAVEALRQAGHHVNPL